MTRAIELNCNFCCRPARIQQRPESVFLFGGPKSPLGVHDDDIHHQRHSRANAGYSVGPVKGNDLNPTGVCEARRLGRTTSPHLRFGYASCAVAPQFARLRYQRGSTIPVPKLNAGFIGVLLRQRSANGLLFNQRITNTKVTPVTSDCVMLMDREHSF
jgi:hypothetical protein